MSPTHRPALPIEFYEDILITEDSCGYCPLSRTRSKMFRERFKASNLSSRLKNTMDQLEKKKKTKSTGMEITRNDVINHLKQKKTLLAEVCVQRIIREDNLLVAMEIVQMLCDVLHKKVGLIESKPDVEESLYEAVSTVIWAAPHLVTEAPELQNVSHQLCLKYSREYGNQCRSGKTGFVNSTVMQKLSAESPSKSEVEKRLCDIAMQAGVEYQSGPGRSGNSPPYPGASTPYPQTPLQKFPNPENIMEELGIDLENSLETSSQKPDPPSFDCVPGFKEEVLNNSEKD
ncbi:IST1 homolog [Rana temporaria]|uniref:IST1 homolog n=1 Tax=Rana temporaria TaxID=8407 RepID=UPI001AAD27FA|nr:IST1 homolog [Rana temporaria]